MTVKWRDRDLHHDLHVRYSNRRRASVGDARRDRDADAYVQFYCTAAASAGQFTIPSVILKLLPANGYGAEGAPGAAIQIAGIGYHPAPQSCSQITGDKIAGATNPARTR